MQKKLGHGVLVTTISRIRLLIISDFIRDTYFLKLKLKREAKKRYGNVGVNSFRTEL
jgi:hypothetical protein